MNIQKNSTHKKTKLVIFQDDDDDGHPPFECLKFKKIFFFLFC